MSGGSGDSRKDRARAIAGFAARLRALRASAGDPSFREMAGRSRAISHTTLHEAAQGHRLPSWTTTVEFVKACGADPEAYHCDWEAANRVVRAAGAGMRASASFVGAAPAETDEPGPVDALPTAPDRPADADPDGQGDDQMRPPGGTAAPDPDVARHGVAWRLAPSHRRYAALVAGTAAITVISMSLVPHADGNIEPRPSTSPAARQVTSADCPVRQQNPPPRPPAHRGDRAAFVTDVTLPDCTHVAHGTKVEKVWRFKNRGTVGWHGYVLHRIDLPQRRDQCQTIVDIPIPDTPPGGLVDIRTLVTTPPAQGFCFVRFKMRDAAGDVAFPGSRPLNFQVIVD